MIENALPHLFWAETTWVNFALIYGRPLSAQLFKLSTKSLEQMEHPVRHSQSVTQSECKVTISCEVNGRTVAQRTEKVPPLAQSYEESLLLSPSPLSPTTKADKMDGPIQ